ncbi:pyrroloquinoline quinone precursor peptide PqqA [Methylibium sp.]|uniref:pyrroloquinoline quinone precursor peptide PqqA n=1 Tax=Methylibium sp. TaxID=2067992 RepID=UPI00345C3879
MDRGLPQLATRGHHAFHGKRHACRAHLADTASVLCNRSRSKTMNWTKPQATDLRYGFEITMYISAR